MNKLAVLVTAIACSLLGFAGGTYFGFKEGVRNFDLLEKVTQGALSRHQLASIENGNLDNVQHLFKTKIDAGLHGYVLYQESGNKALSNHFLPEMTAGLERYVDLMAAYRKEQPIVFSADWALPVDGDDERTKLWREQGYKESVEMLSKIKGLLRERGVPESALTNQGTR